MKDELKRTLLNTGLFINNYYLNKYISTIIKNLSNNDITYQKHHFLPVCYYKHTYNLKSRKDAENYADSDENNFLVELSFLEHFKCHYYLYKCSKTWMKSSNAYALKMFLSFYNRDARRPKSLNDISTSDLRYMINKYKSTLIHLDIDDFTSSYYTMSQNDVCKKFNITKAYYAKIVKRLNLKRKKVCFREFIDKNITKEVLENVYNKYDNIRDVLNELHITKYMLYKKLNEFNIEKKQDANYSMDESILNYYKLHGTVKTCKHFNITIPKIKRIFNKYNIVPQKTASINYDDFITDEIKNYIKCHTYNESCSKFNITRHQVAKIKRKLNITRTVMSK